MQIGTKHNFQVQQLRRSAPPARQSQRGVQAEPTESFTFSGAKAKSGPGIGTLGKVGLGLALTAAVGGAFVAGVQFSQPEQPPTFEEQLQDVGRQMDRGWEDFQIDLQRAKEDFNTGFERGYEDAQSPNSHGRERTREHEDIQREWKRKTEDFTRDAGRKVEDFWNRVTD